MSGDFPAAFDEDRTGYDPRTEEFHARHEWDGERSLTVSIVEAVAVAKNADPTTIGPLYETVDPKALERLLRSIRESERPTRGEIRFPLDGHTVAIGADGRIRVAPASETDPSGR